MNLHPDEQPPKKEEILEAIQQQFVGKKIDMSMMENITVLAVAGGFLHNLNFIDDPLFFEAVNNTIGMEFEDGKPVPENELIYTKVPMTITGYALIDKDMHFAGFACLDSQLEANGIESDDNDNV